MRSTIFLTHGVKFDIDLVSGSWNPDAATSLLASPGQVTRLNFDNGKVLVVPHSEVLAVTFEPTP